MVRASLLVALLGLSACGGGPVDQRINLPGEARRDARREERQQPPPPPPFDYTQYRTVTDCLNAASAARVDINGCKSRVKRS